MHRILIESILADASYQVLVPTSNSTVPDEIVKAGSRSTVFYDETLSFYLALHTGPSSAKLERSQLEELAREHVHIHVVAMLGESGVASASQASATTTVTSVGKAESSPGMAGREGVGATPSLSSSPYNTYGPKNSKSSLAAFKPVTLRFQNSSHHRRSTSLFESDLSGQRSSVSIPHQQQQGYGQQQRQALPSQPNLPTEELLLSYMYIPTNSSRSPMVCDSGNCVLFPLSIRLDVGKTRSIRSRNSQISLTAHLLQVIPKYDEETSLKGPICDPDDFDGVNLFENLDSDPLFGKVPKCVVSNYPMRPTQALATAFKKTVSISLKISPAFSISINTTTSGPSNNMLLAVSIKKPHEFLGDFSVDIKDVQAQMVNALITPTPHSTEYPIHLKDTDQVFLLFNIVLLDQAQSGTHHTLTGDTSHLRMDSTPSSTGSLVQNIQDHSSPQGIDRVRLVSILINIHPRIIGCSGSHFTSVWNAKLRMGPQGELPFSVKIPAFHGRQFEFGKISCVGMMDMPTKQDGIEFSFHVMSDVVLRRVFRVQVLIVNYTSKDCSLSLFIPMPLQPSDLNRGPSRDSFPRLHWDTDDLIDRYTQQHHEEVSIACLESRMDLSTISPNACHLVNLHYIAIKGQVHKLPSIEVLDRDSGNRTTIKEPLQVFVERMNW
ncbi:hypothetical protein BASA50_004930 [Batrachochytrium salamandrivorans]|uniref:Trafficking protein particle complex II-specific subunit 65 IgD3 domain-containing protein n=1 Tax=Batrachochytrium salamandrivorans TaxID=1357716 RepID=A0ABQ8FE70_9FUNG|nr:hypothetical protein BASA50_004930 [Batrachochytrium salamandrivorans]